MKRKIILTNDGSSTIYLPEWNENYHSKHGAIQEAYHVFIENGLKRFADASRVQILEIGFGTGLNALITFLETKQMGLKVAYHGVEAYPVVKEELLLLNYNKQLNMSKAKEVFEEMHQVPWEEMIELKNHPDFQIIKRKQFFHEINDVNQFDLVYFDAFGARVQPDLWTEEIFKLMFNALKKGGILVTYSAKGSVRRAMQACGFEVERLPGPPGKREMLRATKPK